MLIALRLDGEGSNPAVMDILSEMLLRGTQRLDRFAFEAEPQHLKTSIELTPVLPGFLLLADAYRAQYASNADRTLGLTIEPGDTACNGRSGDSDLPRGRYADRTANRGVGALDLQGGPRPRLALDGLARRPEAKRTGVYVLVGYDENHPGRRRIYVGEGDGVLTRIRKHDDDRDFWEHVLLFVSKDENLTKTHVR